MAISYSVRGTPLHSTTGPFTMNDGGTPTTGKLLIAFCNASGQTGTGNASFSGYGLTWTKIGEYGWNSNRESVIFAAFSAGATSAAPTYTPSETPGNGAHVIVLEVTLDSLPTSVYDCFRDQGGGTYVLGNSGTTGAAGNVTLATSPWATANRSFLFAEHGSPSGTNYVLSA